MWISINSKIRNAGNVTRIRENYWIRNCNKNGEYSRCPVIIRFCENTVTACGCLIHCSCYSLVINVRDSFHGNCKLIEGCFFAPSKQESRWLREGVKYWHVRFLFFFQSTHWLWTSLTRGVFDSFKIKREFSLFLILWHPKRALLEGNL